MKRCFYLIPKLSTLCVLLGAASQLSTDTAVAQSGKSSPLAISKPILHFPKSSEIIDGPQVTFRWSKPNTTSDKTIKYALTIEGPGIHEIIQPLTDTFYTFTTPMQEGESYEWYILAWIDPFGGGESALSEFVTFIKGTNEGTAGVRPVATSAFLTEVGSYPNPSINQTQLSFTLTEPTNVSIALYNTLGVKVATVVNSQLFGAGKHTTALDVTRLSAGMYTAVITTPKGNTNWSFQVRK